MAAFQVRLLRAAKVRWEERMVVVYLIGHRREIYRW